MINIHNRSVLLAGIGIKSFVICLWFMHLKFEKRWLIASVAAGFVFALALFFFVHFDAQLGSL
jgi:caa(3)-type oxidase subunit IV